MVVVQNGETTIGLLVDELIGMQEVVLKSLEKNFRSIPGLSGASILGDGRVSLILDLDAVIDMVARQRPARRGASEAGGASDPESMTLMIKAVTGSPADRDRARSGHGRRGHPMGPILTDAHRRLLRMIFDRGAEGASLALSKWLGQRGPAGGQRRRARRAGARPASCSARPRPWSPPAPWA